MWVSAVPGSVTAAVQVKESPVSPEVSPVRLKVGATLLMVTVFEVLLVPPSPSLTVSVTVYEPLSAKVWLTELPVDELPSPKSQV